MSESKRAFLIMPFAEEHHWLHGEIVGAGVDEGVDVERADDIFSAGAILGQILQSIDDADVIIAVCTGKNANVFFELGYAWTKHVPILIAENSSDLPFDVAAFRTIMYGGKSADSSRATFKFRLRKAIQATIGSDTLPRGRVIGSLKVSGNRAELSGRTTSNGKNIAFVVTNSGNVPLSQVDLTLPENVGRILLDRDDLPVSQLRPSESFSVSTIGVMGGGPGIFDATMTAKDPDGNDVVNTFKVSL